MGSTNTSVILEIQNIYALWTQLMAWKTNEIYIYMKLDVNRANVMLIIRYPSGEKLSPMPKLSLDLSFRDRDLSRLLYSSICHHRMCDEKKHYESG